ncbi:MAG: hypothetical protein AAGD05_04550, partial [Bacteroidota bacterium]
LYAASLLLLFTHFRFGNVSAAFVKLRNGQLDEAENLLDQIKRPEWLAKRHRAYYHFSKGLIATQHQDLPEGETHLKAALDLGLRSATDNAMAALNLAHLYFVGQQKTIAQTYLSQAKTFQSDDLLIREKIAELEKVLSL